VGLAQRNPPCFDRGDKAGNGNPRIDRQGRIKAEARTPIENVGCRGCHDVIAHPWLNRVRSKARSGSRTVTSGLFRQADNFRSRLDFALAPRGDFHRSLECDAAIIVGRRVVHRSIRSLSTSGGRIAFFDDCGQLLSARRQSAPFPPRRMAYFLIRGQSLSLRGRKALSPGITSTSLTRSQGSLDSEGVFT